MPQYSIAIHLYGVFPQGGAPLAFTYKGTKYDVRATTPPEQKALHSNGIAISPIEAATPSLAHEKSRQLLNYCLNALGAVCAFSAVLGSSWRYVNVADVNDTETYHAIDVVPVGGASPFPDAITMLEASIAAAYYRRAETTIDPLERCRNYCLAIEDSARRVKVRYGPNNWGDRRLVRDTIERVFKEYDMTKRLKELRDSLRNDQLSPEFQDGKNPACNALNDFVYQYVRCRVAHAGEIAIKPNDFTVSTLSPFDVKCEREVYEVLPIIEEIARYYVRFDFDKGPLP